MSRHRFGTPREGNTSDEKIETSAHRPHMSQSAARSRSNFDQLPSAPCDPPCQGWEDERRSTSPGWGEDAGPARRPRGGRTYVRTRWCAPACGCVECPRDVHSRIAPKSGGATRRALGLKGSLRILLILLILRQADGWIALSSKGYEVKHGLVAQAGVKVQGQIDVDGLIISKPVAKLQCNPSRRGAIRWDNQNFEGCDGETDWKPLTFCSRSCTINTDSVPCGLPVRNRCDKSCNQIGTGMNMRQCILNVAVTPCRHAVRDLCGNACGLEGQMNCESMPKDVGKMILKSTVRNMNESHSAAYELGMRGMNHSNFDNGLFWTFKEKGAENGEDMVVLQKLEETSVPPKFVPPRGPSDKKEIKEKPHGLARGMEISKPPSDEQSTLRVSMFTELTGGYIRVGEDYNSKEKEKVSFIYVDSTVEKQCPFLMNAGNHEGNKFTTVCLEPATEVDREIVLPDASGVIITNGSEADVRSLPGLRHKIGESVLMYSGLNKDLTHIQAPDQTRVDCSKFSCVASRRNCSNLDYDAAVFDMYRLFYGFDPDNSKTKWSVEVVQVLKLLRARPEMTFPDLARTFVSLQVIESGLDLTGLDVEKQLMMLYGFGPITTAENCFVCCCNAYVAGPDKQENSNANYTNAERGVCPHARDRPFFCLSGPKIAQQCIDDDDCIGASCGYDPDIVTCMLGDRGWDCWDVRDRSKLAIKVDFISPSNYRFLTIPAASGTMVSQGNLKEITSLGVQVAPIVSLSSHNTSTTVLFERGQSHLQQVNNTIMNNTLLTPNNRQEAMLLTTGNLEDITLNSSAMTGLSVENDVFVQRLLKFGNNSFNSGILLAPVFPSSEYTTPHSGRPSSYARPGQLSFEVHDSLTVLEFEPAEDGKKVTNIVVPACSGTVVTTGNLESVTAQSGYMSSLAIDLLSHLQGGVVVGTKMETQLTLQGHKDHAMTFETKHSKSSSLNRDENSKTRVTFELDGEDPSNLVFPAMSGTVISTGNMPGIHEYIGSSTEVHREAHFRGPTYVGPTAEQSKTPYIDPILLSGYVTGEIVYREAKKKNELTRPRQDYTAPFTWNFETFMTCDLATLKGFLSLGGPVTRPIFEDQRFKIDPWFVDITVAPLDQCKLECEARQGCGVFIVSRAWKVKLLSVKEYAPTDPDNSFTLYVSNAIRKPKQSGGFLSKDECYPGFSPIFEGENVQDVIQFSPRFDIVMNLTKYPEIETYWTTDGACQGVIAATEEEWQPQFGDAWQGFSELNLQPVKCGATVCEDPENCPVQTEECIVIIQSRVNSFYLTGYQSSECLDQVVSSRPCAKWTNQTTIWTSIPMKLDATHPRYDDWKSLQTNTLFRFRRKGVCLDVDAAKELPVRNNEISSTITCDGDQVQNVSLYWGDVGGACGGFFNTSVDYCDDMEFVSKFVRSRCLGGGCTLTLKHETSGVRLTVLSVAPGSTPVSYLGRNCKGKRFAAEFWCRDQLYLGNPKRPPKAHFTMWPHANSDDTLFHIHSTPELPSLTSNFNGAVDASIQSTRLWRECWLSKAPAHDCDLRAESDLDVHMFMRHDSQSLAFANPSQRREQTFPDTSGIVISSGNLKDVANLRGLQWKDTFMYKHMPIKELRQSDYAKAPVTYVDFAAIGSGPRDRSDGTIPPEFTIAVGGNRRIVFPDSSGTVITTGNIDDLLFKRLNLRGLKLDGDLTFKNIQGPKVKITFEDSTRIAGCLNMVKERGLWAYDHYTQFCTKDPTKPNQIHLPDVSGRMLTTGNLLNLPTMRFEGSELHVGQDMTMEGDTEVGREGSTSEIKAYSWIDGDVGLTFSSPNNSVSIEGDVLRLHSPHMGGVDLALRNFLTDGVKVLNVSVQGRDRFGHVGDQLAEFPIGGTSMINQTMCFDLLTKHHVHGMHGLGYFVHRRHLIQQTILSGTPYWGVEVPGNQTFPACVHVPTDTIRCEGANCTCRGRFEEYVVQWRRIGKQIIQGYRPRCPDQEVRLGGIEHVSDCRYSEALCDESIFNDAGCAFDGNVMTPFRSTDRSVFAPTPFVSVQPFVVRLEAFGTNAFPAGMLEVGQCILGLRLNGSVGVSMVRVFPVSPNRIVGGKLQGSQDPDGMVWVDLHEFKYELSTGVWTDVLLPQWADSRFLFVRYLGPACLSSEHCTCDFAEWEWHQGLITQRLSAMDRGVRSYYVNEEALIQDADGSMVMKCAASGWFPANLQTDVQEILIPEASGTILTTGNLDDVTKLVGTITSAKVSGDAHIRGSTILGARGEETESHWDSLLTGRFPLAMGGGGNYDAAAFFSMPDTAVDQTVYFPPGSEGGRVLTTGMLPPVHGHMSIVGDATLRGPMEMNEDVVIGDLLRPSTLLVHSSISSAFPLSFQEPGSSDRQKLVFGIEEPLGDRVLMLPDMTGTVITTGNFPDVMEGVTLIGNTVFEGPVKFAKGDVSFGAPDAKINLAIHSAIGGSNPLKFEGKQVDQRTLTLSVEEPSGQNVLSLPDVTGTIITTGNFPETVDNLRVLGNVDCRGNVNILGRKISIGHDELKTKLSVNSVIAGRYPLTFGHVSDANIENETLAATTTFEIVPPTGDNVISFPDTSGTVITTGNIPTTLMMPSEYALEVKAFLAIASSTNLGQGAKEGSPKGSFTFTDASQPASQKPNFETKDNSFNVRATGGFKFITGYTASHRELGVVLESKSSAWSILSDENSKIIESRLHDLDTLEKLSKVPISTWRYQGHDVTHMGPMAQDIYAAFGLGEADRISSSDADGAILSALRGMKELKEQLSHSVDTLHHGILKIDERIKQQAARINAKEERLASMLENLETLERLARNLSPPFS